MFEWVKIRPSLLTSPKLLQIARFLLEDTAFRAWVNEEGVAGNTFISDGASRAVTLGALTCAWARAREYGKYHGNDLVIERVGPDFLDAASGVPSMGQAMIEVGWAIFDKDARTLTLPNFREFNAEPMTTAERAKAYRERKKESSRSVTARHESSRLERRGEENIRENTTPPTPSPKHRGNSDSTSRQQIEVPCGTVPITPSEEAKRARIDQETFFGAGPGQTANDAESLKAAAFCTGDGCCGAGDDRILTLAMVRWAGGPAAMHTSWVEEAHRVADETIGDVEMAAMFEAEAAKPRDERARFKVLLARAKTLAGRRGFESAGGNGRHKVTENLPESTKRLMAEHDAKEMARRAKP